MDKKKKKIYHMNKLDILPRKTMSIQNFLLKQTLKKKKKKKVQNQTQHQEQFWT